MFSGIKIKYCVIAAFSSAFLAFGLYHVHSVSGVTEGGVLGTTLLLEQWFDISPSISAFLLSVLCYVFGWKLLGKSFLIYSIVAAAGFSLGYKICEQFEPLWPELAKMPLLASVAGALFVGIGAGICVRIGGAPSGDDALAMSISHLTHIKIQWVYFMCDVVVILLSMTYIPAGRIAYSLLTVVLSGQIIGWVQRVKLPAKK